MNVQKQQASKPDIYNPVKLYVKIAAVLIIGALIGIFAHNQLKDPHERLVEQVVQKHQDGDDVFYVCDNGYYEDIDDSQGSSIILVNNLVHSIDNILSHQPRSDFYFLIPSADTNLLEKKLFASRLRIVKHMEVESEYMTLLTTEVHIP